ncbi:hypothetical protein L3Q67_42015 [Saccharothrix sp. AJ9571]|nr:hypothetical protein L3Q67_42015 [Saccharothrix sp. AJ9571]
MGKKTRAALAGAGVALTAAVAFAQPAAAGNAWPTLRGTYTYQFQCTDAGYSGQLAGRWSKFNCYHNSARVWNAWELYA